MMLDDGYKIKQLEYNFSFAVQLQVKLTKPIS